MLGRVVAERYRVTQLVARGGMGRIYLAVQEPLGREIALKILTRPGFGSLEDSAALEKRFLLEAATCARLVHPNTVTVFDYGSLNLDGSPTFYMAMEFVRGRTLHQVLREGGPMLAVRAVNIAYEIVRSLREAHAAGVVHRDLKPSNVMIVETDQGESVKVLDFGVAKVLSSGTEELTRDGSFIGSPRYSAPEQIRQEGVDGRSDLYALGVVMWEMLTGGAPFSSPEPMRTLMMHLNQPLPAFSPRHPVPPALEALVRRLLSKEPVDRPRDADDLLRLLAPHRSRDTSDLPFDGTLDVEVVADVPAEAPPKRSGWQVGLGAGAFLAVTLALSGAAWWWAGSTASSPAQEGVQALPEPLKSVPVAANLIEGPAVDLPLGAGRDLVRVDSQPSGAEVWFEGKKQGNTPFDLRYDGASAGRSPLAFELRAPGFYPAPGHLIGLDDDGVLELQLLRIPAASKRSSSGSAPDIRMER